MILREFCAENLTDLTRLDKAIISRVELCDNLLSEALLLATVLSKKLINIYMKKVLVSLL